MRVAENKHHIHCLPTAGATFLSAQVSVTQTIVWKRRKPRRMYCNTSLRHLERCCPSTCLSHLSSLNSSRARMYRAGKEGGKGPRTLTIRKRSYYEASPHSTQTPCLSSLQPNTTNIHTPPSDSVGRRKRRCRWCCDGWS